MPMAVSMADLPTPRMSFEPDNQNQSEKIEQRRRLRDFLNLSRWRSRETNTTVAPPQSKQDTPPQTPVRPFLGPDWSRKGLVGIPRAQTFTRQEEEQRKNLTPVEPSIKERRNPSQVRQRALSAVPPPQRVRHEISVPENLRDAYPSIAERIDQDGFQDALAELAGAQQEPAPPPPPPPPQPPPQDPAAFQEDPPISEELYDGTVDVEIMEELKKKWILNLSMHFRDKSPREKFFLTYAETPDRWRRVTVSCDYRDAPKDSLEHDLQTLHYQKDKSARIYESIRMSLPDIQFYDTVTNLKLETRDDRLHVHVTEDVNEIIPYPSVHLIDHLDCELYKESELHFDEHMSGFVYRVNVGDCTWIKKEIPGPDSVDEFLYEVNALNELVGSQNVVQLKGLVINNEGTLIKGLLLAYAEQGALIDIIYDSKEDQIPKVLWERREKWAKQIVRGLSNIHEAGFVQGDFTLSNIVIDEHDEAQIIDINRRGCPVGWESPEMVPLVESGQRLSMYIGVKSDLYQLGMVLWALAMEKDEPERAPRPLTLKSAGPGIPQYYKHMTEICLSSKAKQRFAAKDLLAMFHEPSLFAELRREDKMPLPDSSKPPTEIQDALSNGQREDIDVLGNGDGADDNRYREISSRLADLTRVERGYRVHPQQKAPDADGGISRGRRRLSSFRASSIGFPRDEARPLSIDCQNIPTTNYNRKMSLGDNSEQMSPHCGENDDAQIVAISPTGDHGWEEIQMDGTPYLVHRDTLDDFDDAENIEHAHRGKGVERWRRHVKPLDHVDSGLADMDLSDLPSSDRQILFGIGEHTGLGIDQSPETKFLPQRLTDLEPDEQRPLETVGVGKKTDSKTEDGIDGSNPPRGTTEDLRNELNDEHGETGS